MASFYVQNFGCRATQADGAAIERQLAERGMERAEAPHEAQIVVLNTCTVTASADQDARAAIRRIHRNNPACQIVVTGCYAQRAPQEIAAMPGVRQVVGNSHKHMLAQLTLAPRSAESLEPGDGRSGADHGGFVPVSALGIGQRPATEDRQLSSERPTTNDERPASQRPPSDDQRLFVGDIFAHTELLAAPVFDAANERTRPNLKVQDGCDNRCSFCIIPSVRGHSRSLRLEEVLCEVNTLVESGYREVVISGINLGRWGRDLVARTFLSAASPSVAREQDRAQECARHNTDDRLRFEDLVRAILNSTSLEKLRISSVEPMDWTDSLIRLVAESPRIAKHAHVPMQSGSDRILRAMHRKYRPWHYREKIVKVREAMPTAAIGADVMVGFPGETDADFEETRRMVEELPFTYLHVFTYSSRPGTPAATLSKQVPVQVARERNRVLRELAGKKKRAFMRSFVGKTLEAITLNAPSLVIPSEVGTFPCERGQVVEGPCVLEKQPVRTEALTDNYLKMRVTGHHEHNQWITVRVETMSDGALTGFKVR